MKKILSAILTVTLVFCLCSCNASKKRIEKLNLKIDEAKAAFDQIKDITENVGDASITAEYMDISIQIETIRKEVSENKIKSSRADEIEKQLDDYIDRMIKFQKEVDPNFKASKKIVKKEK